MGVLTGIRILDLADSRGMLAAKILGDMGADVIRIEKPGEQQEAPGAEYLYLNAGKRSISLDIHKKEGQALFRQLVKKADILVESFRPGHMGSLGLGYDDLKATNPRLIFASITDSGQTGPYRDYKSCDLVAQALGGWMSVTGEPDAPLKLPGNQAYYTASLFAANGILLALRQRHETGLGQYLDISVMESVAASLDHVMVRYRSDGIVSGRQGSRHWNGAFQVLKCRDRYILISLQRHWDTLIELLKVDGMVGDLADEKWRDAEVRLKGMDHIIDVLEKWTSRHSVAELVESGQLMRFPWAGVADIAELPANPQLAERGFFTEIRYGDQKYTVPGAPVKMGLTPWRAGGIVPVPGQNNGDVFHDELGLEEAQIIRLKNRGIV